MTTADKALVQVGRGAVTLSATIVGGCLRLAHAKACVSPRMV